MNPIITQFIAQDFCHNISQYTLWEYSKSSILTIRDFLIEEYGFGWRDGLVGAFDVRCRTADLMNNEVITHVINAVNEILTARGYEQGSFGFWHNPNTKEGNEENSAFAECVNNDFNGLVFTYADGFCTGRYLMDNYETFGDYPSSPYEALDMTLVPSEIDAYGNHLCDWSDVVDEFVRFCEEESDLSDYADVWEAVAEATGLDEDEIPLTYKDQMELTFAQALEEQMDEECVED